MRQFTWTETVTADIDNDQLIELFREYAPSEMGEALATWLEENVGDEGPADSILAAIRKGDQSVAVDYSDVSSMEAPDSDS